MHRSNTKIIIKKSEQGLNYFKEWEYEGVFFIFPTFKIQNKEKYKN